MEDQVQEQELTPTPEQATEPTAEVETTEVETTEVETTEVESTEVESTEVEPTSEVELLEATEEVELPTASGDGAVTPVVAESTAKPASDLVVQEKLSAEEVEKLAELEAQIREGEKTFITVGLAIEAIREGKLYREKYKNFEEYVVTELGWTREYAYSLNRSAKQVKGLELPTDKYTVTQATGKELHGLTPEQLGKVAQGIEKALPEGGKVPAKLVADIRKDVAPKLTPKQKWEREHQGFLLDIQAGIDEANAKIARVEDQLAGELEESVRADLLDQRKYAQEALAEYQESLEREREEVYQDPKPKAKAKAQPEPLEYVSCGPLGEFLDALVTTDLAAFEGAVIQELEALISRAVRRSEELGINCNNADIEIWIEAHLDQEPNGN